MANEFYQHYKGGVYRKVCEALQECDHMEMVVYSSMETGQVWVRPKFEFEKNFSLIDNISQLPPPLEVREDQEEVSTSLNYHLSKQSLKTILRSFLEYDDCYKIHATSVELVCTDGLVTPECWSITLANPLASTRTPTISALCGILLKTLPQHRDIKGSTFRARVDVLIKRLSIFYTHNDIVFTTEVTTDDEPIVER